LNLERPNAPFGGAAIAKQEVVELNSKVPVRDERNKKQELEVKLCPDFLPTQARPNVKKLLACERSE
jgi:hypothetical protein